MRKTVSILFLVLANVAFAHHSLSGSYDLDKEIVIEGTIESFEFVNPHPFLSMKVEPKGGGRTQPWRLELDNRYELVEIGVTAKTFKPGDKVVVTGNPGRNDARELYVRRLDRRADNFRYEQPDTTPIIGKISK